MSAQQCRFYRAGHCQYGDKCRYLHAASPPRSSSPGSPQSALSRWLESYGEAELQRRPKVVLVCASCRVQLPESRSPQKARLRLLCRPCRGLEHAQEGKAAYSAGQYLDAVRAYQKAVRVAPSAKNHGNLAAALMQVGQALVTRLVTDTLRFPPDEGLRGRIECVRGGSCA